MVATMPMNHRLQIMLSGGASIILALGASPTRAQEADQARARVAVLQANPPITEKHDVRIERKIIDGQEQVNLWINGKKIDVANMDDVQKALDEEGENFELQIFGEPGRLQDHRMMFRLAPPAGVEDEGDGFQEFRLGDGMEFDLPDLGADGAFTFSQPKAMLGVSLAPISDDLRDYLDLPDGAGVRVSGVVDNTPAAQAGLQEKDIIIAAKIGSETRGSIGADDLRQAISQAEPDTKVTLTILRKGEKQEITATLAKWDATSMGVNLGSGGQLETRPQGQRRLMEISPQLREMRQMPRAALPDPEAMLKMMEQQMRQMQQMLDQLRTRQEQLRHQAEQSHTPEA